MDADGNGWLGLRDRVCVVTGAGGGIGRETAIAFAAAGAKVVVMDRNNESCAETAHEISTQGREVLSAACDVSDPESVAAAARETLATFGRCDVLVNNAGILRPGNMEALSVADWNVMLQVNLTGGFLCSQAFGRNMLERGAGAIVHVSSIAASHPQPFSGAYSPTKAAVTMLSRQIAFEWGPKGVRSNVVSPGLVRTPMSEGFYAAPGVAERREAVVPLRRIATPSDMANVVVFLASDRASYVTGQEIVVDGGFSQTLMSHVPRPGYD
jgi:NAD(P)-dependent dehydrogenase (short-subunit alcohol dehydrogenase family)